MTDLVGERCEGCPDAAGVCACDDEAMRLCDTTKALVDAGTDWVKDLASEECDQLAQGACFAELVWLPQWLPAVCSRHYTPRFLRRFLLAVEAAREKLKTDCELECTAEELAAHAILQEAKDWGEGLDQATKQACGVVDEALGRAQLALLEDIAFEDHDVLLMFDHALDGFSGTSVAALMGAVHLDPADWFKPFRSGSGELHRLRALAKT